MAKKLYYKIGEACKRLDIQPYVLRYWETEFPFLKPGKSRGGQRVYTPEELEVIGRIKQLLYEEGYTIAGAKKKLEAELRAGGVTVDPAAEEDPAAGAAAASEAAPGDRADAATAAPAGPVAPAARSRRGPAVEAPAAVAGSLDSGADEKVETLLAGLREALDRSREILRILEPGAR